MMLLSFVALAIVVVSTILIRSRAETKAEITSAPEKYFKATLYDPNGKVMREWPKLESFDNDGLDCVDLDRPDGKQDNILVLGKYLLVLEDF